MYLKGRKGQEEIVGFVVIVVLVSVVLLVFLGIFLRNNSVGKGEVESVEIFQFLESAIEYTSDCALSYEPDYSKLGELIEQCYSGIGVCVNGERPCYVLNETLREIIDSSFFISEEGRIKGYEFKSVYTNNITDIPKEIILIKRGNCSFNIIGSEILTPSYPGTISSSLKRCY